MKGEPKHARDPRSVDRTQISVVDISRAYFCAEADPDNPTYVALPPEHGEHGKGICAMVLKHMHGTKHAADGWHCEYACLLTGELGFTDGLASPCTYWHGDKTI